MTSAPGPSAVITALTVSGLATDRFVFAGFAPTAKQARLTYLGELRDIGATSVIYESPKRVIKLLEAISQVFGAGHPVVVARELTKKFEEVLEGGVDEITTELRTRTIKGEIVVLIAKGQKPEFTTNDLEILLGDRLKTDTLKDAVDSVVNETGLKRRMVYQTALKLGKLEK